MVFLFYNLSVRLSTFLYSCLTSTCCSVSPHGVPSQLSMHYTDLLQLWDQAVQAVDAQDWTGALAKLDQITEPTSRTLFTAASAHLALGQLEPALRVSMLLLELKINNFLIDVPFLLLLIFFTAFSMFLETPTLF